MNLLRLLLTIFLFLTTCWSLLDAEGVKEEKETSIFWEISGNGLKIPSYLYGTVHMLPESDFFLIEGLEGKVKQTKQIVLEIDMDDPNFMTKTQQLMIMPDNSLNDFMTENGYNTLSKFFADSLNLPLAQFKKIKPFFLTQFILPKIIDKPLASYERTFIQMAKKYQINLTGIESIEEQMNSLDQIPFDKQAELVLETVNEFDKTRILYNQLINTYKQKDFTEFYKLMFLVSKELEEFEELLLIDRNVKWIPRIINLIQNQSCFIAVGVLHLEGNYGVVELLKKEGYTITPIN